MQLRLCGLELTCNKSFSRLEVGPRRKDHICLSETEIPAAREVL